MMVTVEDRRAVSAEVTVEMVEAYMRRAGWSLVMADGTTRCCDYIERDGCGAVRAPHGLIGGELDRIIEAIARQETRQPSEVLSDIVGYQVGLDRGRASVLRNSAGARVVEAREALAKMKPHNAAEYERARARLAQAEAELAAATRALEATTAAEAQR
jgi:hypothetical protein